MKKIGKVSHYYNKIEVAVIELESELKVGDKVRFARGGEDLFEQEIMSIQLEHEDVQKAAKGDSIGIRIKQKVKEGAEVYRL